MALIVQKYGGTSVASVERIEHVADKVIEFCRRGDQVVVVLSAMSGETNRLIALGKAIHPDPTPRENDVLISTGEQVTVALLALALHHRGQPAKSYTGSQVRILTDSTFGKARILEIDDRNIRSDLDEGQVVIVAGFQGCDAAGNITTLGRGGSDTTAVALAAALNAEECQIYTDVDGVYTTDPRIEPKARKLDRITFEEMVEMAGLGSKVLQIRSVEFAGKYRVKLRVLSSFQEGEGTLITFDDHHSMESPVIAGVTCAREEAQINVVDVPDAPGVAAAILGPIADANINVDMIIQNIAEDGKNDFTFTVARADMKKTLDLLQDKLQDMPDVRISGTEIAKVSIVGVGMHSNTGVASTMFRTLAEHGINIRIISTSEIKVSVGIDEKYVELAVRALHEAFHLAKDDEASV